MRFSSVSTNAFVQNHCSHNFLFSIFEFFSNKVDAGFFNHSFDWVGFIQRVNFFFYSFFSFFKFILSVCSVKVVICVKNHIISCIVNNLFKFRCIVRVYEFFFNNAASLCKLNLSVTLFSDFSLSKFNSVHNIVFCNEFAAGFNHNNAVVSTCNNDVEVRFVRLLVSWVSNHIAVFVFRNTNRTDRTLKRST